MSWRDVASEEMFLIIPKAGFRATAVGAKAYPHAKRDAHTLFIADRLG